jgi:hypothetical protein
MQKNLNFKKPIANQQIGRILANKFNTLRLVSEYKFFNTEGNTSAYYEFIDVAISKKTNIYNAIEMATIVKYRSPKLLLLFKSILSTSRSLMLKLSCLDYLIENRNSISVKEYNELCRLAGKHTRSSFIKMQAIMNMLLINPGLSTEIKSLYKLFDQEFDPGFFYRVINNLKDFRFDKSLIAEISTHLQKSLLSKSFIRLSQRKDFKRELQIYCN